MIHKNEIETVIGAKLRRGWILDGAGPARFGWASIWPCKERWEGRTLAEISCRLRIVSHRHPTAAAIREGYKVTP